MSVLYEDGFNRFDAMKSLQVNIFLRQSPPLVEQSIIKIINIVHFSLLFFWYLPVEIYGVVFQINVC